MEDEKPNNCLNMIDRFAENGLQHIRMLLDNFYHLIIREERSNEKVQKQLYATLLKLPYS